MGPGAAFTAAAARQAEVLRTDGNSFFGKHRYGAAIDAYTEVLILTHQVNIQKYKKKKNDERKNQSLVLLCHFLQICKRGFCWVSSFVNSVFFPFFMALIHLIFLLFKHQAIALCPNVPVYWTNRALCHRRRKYVRALPHFLCLSPYLDYISSGYFFFLALVFLRFTLLEFSDWTKVEEDSRKAIELDYNSVKVCIYGFFLLILILHSCILVFELDHS